MNSDHGSNFEGKDFNATYKVSKIAPNCDLDLGLNQNNQLNASLKYHKDYQITASIKKLPLQSNSCCPVEFLLGTDMSIEFLQPASLGKDSNSAKQLAYSFNVFMTIFFHEY